MAQEPGKELTVRSFTEMQSMGVVFAKSGMFPDIKTEAQAIVKIQAGAEMGLPPFYAMTKIYIVQGRLMVGAEAMGAMVKRSKRYDYRLTTYTDQTVAIQFTDNGKDVFLSSFSIEDARKAGLVKPGSGWEKFPRAMIMSKALSQGARIVCPEVISGAYTPEDFGYAVNPETEQLEGQVEEKPTVKVEVIKPVPVKEKAQPVTKPAPAEEPLDFDKKGEPQEMIHASEAQITEMKKIIVDQNLDQMQIDSCAQKTIGKTFKKRTEITMAEGTKMIEALKSWSKG